MKANLRQRDVRYAVLDDHLIRTVSGSDGRTYVHRCSRPTYETVAYALDETPAEGDGITGPQIARAEDLPFSQVNVALEFMKERSVALVRSRRSYPASDWAFEDAMIEYFALAEKA